MENELIFNYRLKFVRERNGIKQKETANILNLNKSTYSNYESERYIIPLKYLVIFCDYFKISLDYVLGFNENLKYSYSKSGYNLKTVSIRLKEFRKQFNLSQEGLAIKINVKRNSISDYETGKYLITTFFLYSICKKYKISADYLLGKIDEPKYLD